MLSPDAPLVLLLHGGSDNLSGKTGLAMLRYRHGPIVAVIDPAHAGEDLPALTGIPRPVPLVANMAAALAYGPAVAVVGLFSMAWLHRALWHTSTRALLWAGLAVGWLAIGVDQWPEVQARWPSLPELPGMPGAELFDRQVWWLATVLATLAGLALVALPRNAGLALLGLALIVAPHVVGAPHPAGEEISRVPPALAASFVSASLVTAAVFWGTLGALSRWLQRSR